MQAIWIVEFYSDHCPFCKSLAPELLKAAKSSIEKHASKVRFGGLNTRIFNEVGTKFNITGFPWVSCFYRGEKTDDMAGLGGADSVINWANKKILDHNPSGGSAPAGAASPSGRIF
jgi:thioredoxin-like negative regulator of GroEL